MKVVFRVDASLVIGSGHVMRCLVLADELKRKGHDLLFACLPLDGDMRLFICERGFDVITLPESRKNVEPTHNTDYVTWLQKSVIEDARDFLTAVAVADLVITDHYAIGKEWQCLVTESLHCRLLAIDDLARLHQADLVLDQTLGRLEVDYAESKAQVLAGSEYALLQRGFLEKREFALSRELSIDVPKILISMGGVDVPNVTTKVLEALHSEVNAEFTVLLSRMAPHFNEVRTWCLLKSNVTHLEFVSDMASLILSHDVAIGAPGTTSWERACLGLPNLIVPLAENQQLVCEQLVKHNATIKVDIVDIPKHLITAYKAIIRQWQAFKLANLVLCDGRGARRVVFEIEQLFSEDAKRLSLDYASQEDIVLVYDWQCHPDTRKYALTPSVPTWEEHHAWMSGKLQVVSDYFYMIVDKEHRHKIGVVRLDRMYAGHYRVSIFINPQNYGNGIAYTALNIVDAIYPDVTLHATVLKVNVASQRLFQKACYEQVDAEKYIRQPID